MSPTAAAMRSSALSLGSSFPIVLDRLPPTTTRSNSDTTTQSDNSSTSPSVSTPTTHSTTSAPRTTPLTSTSVDALPATTTPTSSKLNNITTATSAPWPIPASKPGRSGGSERNRANLALDFGLIIPHSQSSASSSNPSPCSSSLETPNDPFHWQSRENAPSIPEECDEETCSESLPNDPVTPVSGRQSQEFRFCDNQDYYGDSVPNSLAAGSISNAGHLEIPLTQNSKTFLQGTLSQSVPTRTSLLARAAPTPFAPLPEDFPTPTKEVPFPEQNAPHTSRSLSKRHSTLSKAMSFLRRGNHHSEEQGAGSAPVPIPAKESIDSSASTSESNLGTSSTSSKLFGSHGRRRFSYHRSVATTRSNTPPSAPDTIEPESHASLRPTSGEYLETPAKKHRALTGLSLRHKVNFVSAVRNQEPRRAKSVERKKDAENDLTRQPWAIPPDAGTGMKARRLSLSLPDDFTIDVGDLQKEYEYHNIFGRHGKHLGKGATAKVSLMERRGYPGELYAVKEFRSRGSFESHEDYEQKIKSEFSIAKSLHHPNVIETFQLCTDHGRWNHVMEYCSEGDLFSLVAKKYLKEEGRDVDRVCLFKQLCQGINYLHKNGIAHRDIKLENLLITKDSKLKITDFGVSEVFSGIHPGLREAGGQCGIGMGEIRLCKPGICGSLPYIAPEVISKTEAYDPRALDVWSSAIVMIYLIFGAPLWEKAGPNNVGVVPKNYTDLVAAWDKAEAKRAAKPEDAKDIYPRFLPFDLFVRPLPLRRLLLNMLQPDPKKRVTMNEVVTNRWLKNAECCQFESYDEPIKYIDASKKASTNSTTGKIFCHNHLPPMSTGHGLPPMPGKPGY